MVLANIYFDVIPAEAGIQCFQILITDLDPGLRRGDDFLRVYQSSIVNLKSKKPCITFIT